MANSSVRNAALTKPLKPAAVAESKKRKRGRPEQVSEVVFNATGELLSEIAIQSLSFELLAERAGVHKTTLYRRWGKPANLIAEFLKWVSTKRVPMPDTGTLEGDIKAFVKLYATHFNSDLGKTINRILIDNQASASEELADWVKIHYEYQLKSYTDLAKRALDRGEINRIADFLFATELIVGPMLLRSTLSGFEIDDAAEDKLVAVALAYLT